MTWTEADVRAHCARHGLPLPRSIRPLQPVAASEPDEDRGAVDDEDALQLVTAQWLRENEERLGLVALHPPNEGRSRRTIEAAIQVGRGMRPGAADWILLAPTWSGAIELKARGGSLSASQRAFRDDCRARGVRWALCRSLEALIETAERWAVDE